MTQIISRKAKNVMDENVRLAYLYDIYGELLSEHQRKIFEAARFDDLSFSEIAENFAISRQAGHDVYKRTVQKLEHYEERLKQLAKYMEIRGLAEQIRKLADQGMEEGTTDADGSGGESGVPADSGDTLRQIAVIADEIVDKL